MLIALLSQRSIVCGWFQSNKNLLAYFLNSSLIMKNLEMNDYKSL